MCPTCGKEITGRNQKFCSATCYHQGQKKKLTTHRPRIEIPSICHECGRGFILHRKVSRWTKGLFCSVTCANKAQGKGRRNSTGDRAEIYEAKKKASCLFCTFSRFIEVAHIIPDEPLTWDNSLFVCPNHHRLFDYRLLSLQEVDMLPLKAKVAYLEKRTFDHTHHMKGLNHTPRHRPLQDKETGKFLRRHNEA